MKVILGLLASCVLAVSPLAAQSTKPDNSKMNGVNGNATQPTADRQSNTRSDVETTQQIRKAIVAEKGLSTYAHNVKIITKDGHVTLRGPVRSEEEKQTVESRAAEIAGKDHVKSEIQIVKKKTRLQ